MKKKTITTLGALVTAAVIFIGSYITQNGNINFGGDAADSTAASQTSASQITSNQSNSNQASQSQSSQGKTSGAEIQGAAITFPESVIKPESEGIAPFGYINAVVTKVTDGDTVRIIYKKHEYKVRLLDIDTPESVKAGVPPQPYSKEASNFTKEMLTGKEVTLIFEKDTTDQYDRLLAYIILQDGTFYNALLVKDGYAISVFYNPNTLLKGYFTELQNQAMRDNKGFWQLPEKQRPFIEDSKGRFIAAYKLKKDAA